MAKSATLSAVPQHAAEPLQASASKATYPILGAISASHLVNDMMQSLILALYPVLKGTFDLSFGQIGLITLVYQLTASLLQPLIGFATDRRPMPQLLPLGMLSTLTGLMLLAFAPSYAVVLLAAACVGLGSAVFHPESSRIARLASGGQHGLAQSLFQVGGNAGTAFGPLLAAAVIVPFGQRSVAWFGLTALLAIVLLLQVSRWYATHHVNAAARAKPVAVSPYSRRIVGGSIAILLVLIFSKYFYVAGLSSFYTFYLIDKFGLSVQTAQVYLFIFLAASAVGTVVGSGTGCTTISTFIESTIGVEAGGRTGLTAIVSGVLFLVCIFLSPLFLMIPTAVTGVALIFVGFSMLSGFTKLDFSDFKSCFGPFVMILFGTFTGDIAAAICLGVLTDVLIKVLTGDAKKVHPVLYVLCIPLVLYFIV